MEVFFIYSITLILFLLSHLSCQAHKKYGVKSARG
jgi:hypothetical protein